MTDDVPVYVAVVEDDRSVCQALGRLFRAADMQPVTYSSAEAFLSDFKRPQFDCVIADVRLGGMSGLDFARRLRTEGVQTPFIFVTACESSELMNEAGAIKDALLLPKTSLGSAMLDTIRRLTSERTEGAL